MYSLIAMIVVTVRVDENIVKLVDHMVKEGIFKSRGDAFRLLIQKGLEHVSKENSKVVDEVADYLVEMDLKGRRSPLKIKGVREELIKERDRW